MMMVMISETGERQKRRQKTELGGLWHMFSWKRQV